MFTPWTWVIMQSNGVPRTRKLVAGLSRLICAPFHKQQSHRILKFRKCRSYHMCCLTYCIAVISYRRLGNESVDTLAIYQNDPDSKVHGANMWPNWGRQGPGVPDVGPMNFAIRGTDKPELPIAHPCRNLLTRDLIGYSNGPLVTQLWLRRSI